MRLRTHGVAAIPENVQVAVALAWGTLVATSTTVKTRPSPRVLAIVIAEAQAMEGQALRLSRAVTEWLARSQGMYIADLVETLDPAVQRAQAADVEEAMAMVRRGMVAFEGLDLDVAGAELDMAANLLLSNLPALTPMQRRALDEALFTLATTTLFEGSSEIADGVFIALALLSPTFQPSGDAYPSNVITRYAGLKRGVDTRATGAIEVVSDPLGAAVYVDGVFRGSTPLTIEGLADGQHAVVVERLGYRSFGTLSPAAARRTSRVDLDLERTLAVPVVARLTPGFALDPEAALALGRTLALDRLAVLSLTVRLAQPRVSGLWLDVGAGKVLATVPATAVVQAPDVAASAVVGAIAAAVSEREEAEAAASAAQPFEWPPWIHQWWFWAAVGGVAVAAATTAGVVAAATGPDDRPKSGFAVFGF